MQYRKIALPNNIYYLRQRAKAIPLPNSLVEKLNALSPKIRVQQLCQMINDFNRGDVYTWVSRPHAQYVVILLTALLNQRGDIPQEMWIICSRRKKEVIIGLIRELADNPNNLVRPRKVVAFPQAQRVRLVRVRTTTTIPDKAPNLTLVSTVISLIDVIEP